jgi:Ca2+-binding EF-hand superfamily protein
MVPFLIPLLLAAADAPINVVGHAWAPFISPMGEPFRARTAADDTLANWFRQADRNHDGSLTIDEMQADADRFFATLDENSDGELDPDEIARYEYEVAPDVQVMSRLKRAPGEPAKAARPVGLDGEPVTHKGRERRRADEAAQLGMGGNLQGGARYALLNIPEPVAAADLDFNRGVSHAEFRQAAVERFNLLDTRHGGRLLLADLQATRAANWAATKKRTRGRDKDPDQRVGNGLPADRQQLRYP